MKTVLITGADRGVGLALCEVFLKNGWRVLAGQFMPEWPELQTLQASCPDALHLLPLDVSDTGSVRGAASLVQALGMPVDMLISCAGIARGERRAVYNVNVVGTMRVAEHFLPLMAGGDKRLCFVSSEAGCVTLAHRTDGFAYTSSKTALNMAVRRMFRTLRPEGFTFRLYHPGWVRSYMGGGEKSTVGNFEPEETAAVAYRQFTQPRAAEDVLVMTDVSDEMWPY